MADNEDDEERTRKHRTMVHNERIRFIAATLQATLIGVIGFGLLRLVFDPDAPNASAIQVVLTTFTIVGLVALVWFVLGRLRPED